MSHDSRLIDRDDILLIVCLGSAILPISTSQVVRIIGVSHHAQPQNIFKRLLFGKQ
jgi:hypothetical protein